MIKKIAFLLPSLKGGGVQRQMINLSRAFLKRGLDVEMVLLDGADPAFHNLPPDLQIFDLKNSRALTALGPLSRYLRAARPDVLFSAQTHINFLAVLAREITRLPACLIVEEHGHLSATAHNATRLGDRLRPWLVRLAYPRADGIVAVSAGVADDLARVSGIPRQQIRAIHNSIDLEEITRLSTVPLDHPWFKKDQPPVVLAVGRLTVSKGYADLLNAFSSLRSRMPARLLILGDGEERQNLQRQIEALGLSEDVAMPGFVANPFAYMAQAGLLAVASHWEGFVNVLPEALACGMPVVSTDCPSGPREVLEDGKYGRLVPVGDPGAMANAMQEMLNSPPSIEWQRARAQIFSIERVANEYYEYMTGKI